MIRVSRRFSSSRALRLELESLLRGLQARDGRSLGTFPVGDGASAIIQTLLETLGVRRDVAARWPEPLGFRIVSRLAERGRVAFALTVAPKDVKRAGRVRVPKCNACARRIEADEIRCLPTRPAASLRS
jgi:hypothetical protein